MIKLRSFFKERRPDALTPDAVESRQDGRPDQDRRAFDARRRSTHDRRVLEPGASLWAIPPLASARGKQILIARIPPSLCSCSRLAADTFASSRRREAFLHAPLLYFFQCIAAHSTMLSTRCRIRTLREGRLSLLLFTLAGPSRGHPISGFGGHRYFG